MAGFAGPTLGFSCGEDHQTCRNIRQTGEFTVNVPSVELAAAVWAMPEAPDRFAQAGLSTTPGQTVSAPAVAECFAHLECALDQIIEFGHGEIGNSLQEPASPSKRDQGGPHTARTQCKLRRRRQDGATGMPVPVQRQAPRWAAFRAGARVGLGT
jgi:hypothetical protein